MIEQANTIHEKNFDIGKIFRLILMQSKLILLTVFIVTTASIFIYLNTTKIYKISSLLQVYSSNTPTSSSNISMDFLLGGSNNADLDNLAILYDTRTNIKKLIQSLNLNIEIFENENFSSSHFKYFTLYNEESGSESFYFRLRDSSFEILDNSKELLLKSSYGELIDNNSFSLILNRPDIIPDEDIKIKIFSINDLIDKYQRLINVIPRGNSSFYLSNGLINVSLLSDDIEKAKKIVDKANEIFITNSIKAESEKAKKAISFIDERISSIENVLDINKTRLKEFQEKNKSLNVDLEIQSIIENIAEIESQINKINIEITQASRSYTPDNPLYKNFIDKKEELVNQKAVIENKIKLLPVAQQQYIDLYRDVEISQEIFTELLNRRLSFSIIEASTIGNIRVVDDAYEEYLISPTPFLVIAYFLLSLILSVGYAIIRGLYFLPISNPAEIDDSGISNPILGVTPAYSDKELNDEINLFNNDVKFNQSMESLIININTILDGKSIEGCNKLLITSPTPANGKTFLSRSLARKYASMGYKVLLIDNDLKKGKQHRYYEIKPLDQDIFYDIDESGLNKFQVENNLYLIPKIKSLTSSFQFLYSSKYLNKIKELSTYFDYIIFDTAPLLSVADTSILMSISDINISLARHNATKISELKQLLKLCNQSNSKIDGIIYNAYEKPAGYYGYYNLYGNYNYQYYADKYLYEKDYYEKEHE